MTTKTETAARKPEQQPARKPHAGLAAHYKTIGNAAVRAALQFRKPGKPAVAK